MASAARSRRIRRLVVGGVTVVLLGSAGAGVAHAAGFLGLTPDEGAPGTPYKVTVTCDQKPTLYGAPLDGNPPGTQVPLSIASDGATQWTYDATAGRYDDRYGATCGDESEQARFDADAPRLYLGPLAEGIQDLGRPITEVDGTDCPAGTTASVTIALDGTTSTHTATIGERGDWAVPLAAPLANTQTIRAEATCGTVTYTPLLRAGQLVPPVVTGPTTPQTTPSTSSTSTTRSTTTPPPAPAAPAQAQRTQRSYTG